MKREVWHPVPVTEAECYALKALAEGKADEAAQKRLFGALMKITRLKDENFVLDQHVSTFLQGKRAVGLQLVEMLNYVPKRKGE